MVFVCSESIEEGEVEESRGTANSEALSVSSVPGAPCPALVLLLRDYATRPQGALSIAFSLQSEALVDSCVSRLRQQRLYQTQQSGGGHSRL